MTVVVDIGCATQDRIGSEGFDESLGPLIERFQPDELYGFDPWPYMAETDTKINGTRVVVERKAAWIFDGEVMLAIDGIRSTIIDPAPRVMSVGVPCFDLAFWLLEKGSVILKIDAEGAEYALLDHLIATGVIGHVEQLIVEWHPVTDDWRQHRARILTSVPCHVAEW